MNKNLGLSAMLGLMLLAVLFLVYRSGDDTHEPEPSKSSAQFSDGPRGNKAARSVESAREQIHVPSIIVRDLASGTIAKAQYRLRHLRAQSIASTIRDTGVPDQRLLEGDWDVVDVRSLGYVGATICRDDLQKSGYVIGVPRAATVECAVLDNGKPVKGVHVALLPPVSGRSEWQGDWRAHFRASKVPDANRSSEPDTEMSFGSVRVSGELFHWRNSLATWFGTTGADGKLEFTNVVPGEGYRVGFVQHISLERCTPPLTKMDGGVLLKNGSVRVDAGPPRLFTDSMSLSPAEKKTVVARLSSGIITGNLSSSTVLGVNLYNATELEVPGQAPFRVYTDAGSPRRDPLAFTFENVPRGLKRLVVSWMDRQGNVVIYAREFRFHGGELNLGLLKPHGRRVELVPSPADKFTSKLANAGSLSAKLKLTMKGPAEGCRIANVTVHWDFMAPLVFYGVPPGRCSIYAEPGIATKKEGFSLELVPPNRFSTDADQTRQFSFKATPSQFVHIVATGSGGVALVDRVHFLQIFESGFVKKRAADPEAGRAHLPVDIGGRDAPMAIFAYCEAAREKGEMFSGGRICGLLMREQMSAGRLELSLGGGDGASGTFDMKSHSSGKVHVFNVWLILKGLKNPALVFTCNSDRTGRFRVGGIPRGVNYALDRSDQIFVGTRVGLLLKHHK